MHHPHLPPPSLPVLLRTNTTWTGLEAYLRTFSALHTFARVHGDAAADEAMYGFFNGLRSAVDAERTKTGTKGEAEEDPEALEIEWPVALVLAKRA